MKGGNMINYQHQPRRSVLATLRGLIPAQASSFSQALRLAELQAARFLELQDITEAPVSEEAVLSLPRIRLRYHQLAAASGMTYWNGEAWVIGINSTEPMTRQRFTILHEYKHIVDHGSIDHLYSGDRRRNADRQAELAADYFAGCVLMPTKLIKRAWFGGMQQVSDLAQLFDVSSRAIEVRLDQLGLRDESDEIPRGTTRRPSFPQRARTTYLRLPASTTRFEREVLHV
jgi:Zn-dependent peptidase ImmA (M78 family)